ncbi:MAG TPA: MgtC/SapB family protein [Dehalococcoidia bacterium]|nr:MgtC/SapB family protein [Dehalococcoidia bacterium]
MHLVQDSAWPVLVATALSAVVGIERQWRGHSAGLRTHMLVGIGAALATVAGRYGFSATGSNGSPDRIAAQVISGIGFLGAGSILKERSGIHGLTTAATLWTVAALGVACGAGLWATASLTTLVMVVALVPVQLIERAVRPQPRPLGVTVHDPAGTIALATLERVAEAVRCEIHALRRERVPGGAGVRIDLELLAPRRVSLAAVLDAFEAVPGVGDAAIRLGEEEDDPHSA